VAPSEAVADGAHPERRCAWISPPNTRPISSSSCSHSTSRSASLRGASMPSLRPSGGHCHAAGIATPTQEFVKLRGHLNVQGARALVNGGMVMMDTASYTPLKVIRNRGEETVLVH
jgi:hypothetical protein